MKNLRDIEPPKPLLSDRDLSQYSLGRAIEAAERRANHQKHLSPASFEDEVSQELERDQTPTALGGVIVPLEVFSMRGAHEVATGSKGAELKFTDPAAAIPFLFKKSIIARLGATVLTGLVGDSGIPRRTAAMTPEWLPESQTADTTQSAMLFDRVLLQPKLISATTSYTRLLLQQSARIAKIDALIRDDFSRAFSQEVDVKAVNGLGTSNEPRGILNTSGIGSVVGGANGAAPTHDHLVDLEHEVAVDNADADASLGYLTSSQIRRRLRKTAGVSASSGVPVWLGDSVLGGRRAVTSQSVPSNLTKGTSTTICSAIIFGAWEELIVGQWGRGVEVVVDPFVAARKGDIFATLIAHVDVGVRHPASFSAMTDALNQ